VAGLWSWHPLAAIRALTPRLALGFVLVTMAGCSQIALPDSAQPLAPQPPYVSLAAKYLQSALKDVRAYDGFEISPLRWVLWETHLSRNFIYIKHLSLIPTRSEPIANWACYT